MKLSTQNGTIKKLRRRVEDRLRKSSPSVVIAVATLLGINTEDLFDSKATDEEESN